MWVFYPEFIFDSNFISEKSIKIKLQVMKLNFALLLNIQLRTKLIEICWSLRSQYKKFNF